MKLFIQGMGAVLPSGGIDDLKKALESQTTPPEPLTCDTDALTQYIPARRLRRIDHFTRMTLLAAYRALDNAGRLHDLPESMGIILCTGYGPAKTTFDFLDTIIDDGPELASPLAFSHSVHNIPAGVLSMLLGTPCPQTTLCQLHSPVAMAIRTAALWLAEKRVDSVLVGGTDEATPLLRELTERMAPESGNHRAPVGEGSAFLLLSGKEEGNITIELDSTEQEVTLPDSSHLWGSVPVSPLFETIAAAVRVADSSTYFLVSDNETTIKVTGEN